MAVSRRTKNKRSQPDGKRRSSSAQYRQTVLKRTTENLLGKSVLEMEFPGGQSRESIRMLLEDSESIIATRRDKLERARTETRTLQALNRHNAPVPRLLATNYSHILLQQELLGERLSRQLHDADEARYAELTASTLLSLSEIHHAASEENLESLVDTLGAKEDWLRGLLSRPRVIGKYLKTPAPKLDKAALIQLLRVETPRFIKWDARPGNALVVKTDEDSERIYWFDWEHAGKRNRLDDVAWILCDEFVPDYPTAESALIDQYLHHFSDWRDESTAYEYLMVYGSFHTVIRLGLILKHMQGEWWDIDYCIEGDRVGVTLDCARRLCQRGSRWSSRVELTQAMSPWFEKIQSRLNNL